MYPVMSMSEHCWKLGYDKTHYFLGEPHTVWNYIKYICWSPKSHKCYFNFTRIKSCSFEKFLPTKNILQIVAYFCLIGKVLPWVSQFVSWRRKLAPGHQCTLQNLNLHTPCLTPAPLGGWEYGAATPQIPQYLNHSGN